MASTSTFDKMLREIAPRLAARRLIHKHNFDVMAGGYDGAIDSRFRTHEAFRRSMPGDEDHVIGPYDRERIRLECRDLYRNNEVTAGAVDRFADYAIWLGIWPQARTSNKTWNDEAEAWWKEIYVPTCDYRQRKGVDMTTFQRLIVMHRPLDGESGFVAMANGQLMPVEAERIQTPHDKQTDTNIVEGIRKSKKGIILGYYISPRNDRGTVDKTNTQYVRTENFFHCYAPKRIDQMHGIPDLAPAINKLRDYDTTDQNVLNKVKNDAMQLFNRKESGDLANEISRRSYTKTDNDDKNQQRVEKHEFGQIFTDGGIEPIESKTPNQQYVGYMEHQLRTIAACLGIPYEYLMLIFTAGSFSAQRAAMLHAQHTFIEWHQWVVQVFQQPVWNWRIAKAIKDGDLPPAPTETLPNGLERSEWFKTDWSLPYFGWVDPAKKAKADKEEFNLGTTSIKAINRTQGRDRDDVFAEKTTDYEAAIVEAEGVNKRHPGAGMTWRDWINTATPGQVTTDQAKATTDSTSSDDDDDDNPDAADIKDAQK